ncbi:MAG: dihydropyrimidinase [Candidatus Bipolaricaulota bacterium]|nr:dihydropyrimidinase [Candidatus Bipolaricaulota bacterium]
MKFDYIIKNGNLVSRENSFEADIGITDGKISAIGKELGGDAEEGVYDAGGCYVTPGFIDSHTHMSLPVSNTVSSDDFFTGGRAGAWGGVTTIIDFTTPEPGQTPAEAIRERKKEAGTCPIDFSFHGTLYGYNSLGPEDLQEAIDMGVTSFKFFTAYGESNRRTPDGELLEALTEIGKLDGLAMVHCENDEIIAKNREELKSAGKRSIEYHPESRPDYSESVAVGEVIHLANASESNLHLAHLTTKESVELLNRGKGSGIDLSGETCPQYLLLTEARYEDEDGHRYASTPPLRLDEDREALWHALDSGVLDSVATDHCPFRNDQKDEFGDDFLKIPQGLPGVETLGSLMFSEGVRKDRLSIERMVELISENPARRFGLYPEKGSLKVGTDADIVVLDPDIQKTIEPGNLHMNTDFNPFTGKTSHGWPRFVFLSGRPVLEGEKFVGREGGGSWINRRKRHQSG